MAGGSRKKRKLSPGVRQLSALGAAPEIRAEGAAAFLEEMQTRGPEGSTLPENRRFLPLLAGISAAAKDEEYLRSGKSFLRMLKHTAPIVKVRAGGTSRNFRLFVVEDTVVLRLSDTTCRGVLPARQPEGFLESALEVEWDIKDGGNVLPAARPRGSLGPLYPPVPIEDGAGAPRTIVKAARELAEKLQQVLDERGEPYQRRLCITSGREASEIAGDICDGDSDGPALPWREALELKDTVLASPPGGGMRTADLSASRFEGGLLARTDFREAILSHALFTDCDLREADFRKAKLNDTAFRRCDLTDTDLSAVADICAAKFSECSLRRVGMRGLAVRSPQIAHCDLRGADLRNTEWSYLASEYKSLIGADLRGARLHGADLRGISLGGCDMRGVRGLAEAKLEGCDLSRSQLDHESTVIAALGGALVA